MNFSFAFPIISNSSNDLTLGIFVIHLCGGDIAGSRGHGRLGNCHQFRKQRHALSCRGSREKKNFLDRGSPARCTKMWMRGDGSHFSPRSPERFTHVRRLIHVPGPHLLWLGGCIDAAAAAVTMSGKKAAEKTVSEIDAHISKQYDIVRRLGKGVITLSPLPLDYPRAENFNAKASRAPSPP